MPNSGLCDAISCADGHLAGVEMLPLGLSGDDAIAGAHTLCLERKGPFDGFEIWDGGRVAFSYPTQPRSLRPG
jgi:hypothetical protein